MQEISIETYQRKKRKYQRERNHMNTDLNEKLKQYRKNYYASKKIGDTVVNKRKFYASKEAIALILVDTSKIVFSDKFRQSDDVCKYFIGYLHDDDVIRPLCIILPQMSEYIKYFNINILKLKIKVSSYL